MWRSTQKGVFRLVIEVTDREEGAANPIRCKVERSWPNSSGQSLGGCIFEMSVAMDRLVDEAALDRLNEGYARRG